MPERLAFAMAVAIAACVGAVPAALATEGSVPGEVSRYAADPDGMLPRLNDVFGVGADGQGIDFDDTTKAGPISRVFVWTDDFLAGARTDSPIELVNEWVTGISINEKPIGVATIWINQSTVAPELADFVRGVDFAVALSDLPADASLVHDPAREAWFTLVGTALTPVVAGTSGISGPTTVSVFQNLILNRTDVAAPVAPAIDPTIVIGGAAIAIAIIVIVVALMLPRSRRKAKAAVVEDES